MKLGSNSRGQHDKFIERRLRDIGLRILKPPSCALVEGVKRVGRQGLEPVLEKGMEERFQKIGNGIGTIKVRATIPRFSDVEFT